MATSGPSHPGRPRPRGPLVLRREGGRAARRRRRNWAAAIPKLGARNGVGADRAGPRENLGSDIQPREAAAGKAGQSSPFQERGCPGSGRETLAPQAASAAAGRGGQGIARPPNPAAGPRARPGHPSVAASGFCGWRLMHLLSERPSPPKCGLGPVRFLREPPDAPLGLGVLEGTPLAAVPSRSCPTNPARSPAFAVFSSLSGFCPGTFQEPESRDSAGQRAFVRRLTREGQRGGPELGDPRWRGCRAPGRGPRAGVPRELGLSGGPGKGSGDLIGWIGGGPGVQRVAWAIPYCAPPEAAVIFCVCMSFELIRSLTGSGPR